MVVYDGVGHNLDEVGERSPEAIEAPDHEHVVCSEVVERLGKLRTVRACSGRGVGEDFLAATSLSASSWRAGSCVVVDTRAWPMRGTRKSVPQRITERPSGKF